VKFSEYPYVRPDMDELEQQFRAALERFSEATTAEEQDQLMADINRQRMEFNSMQSIASIRHTIDTRDEFYAAEQDFFDENSPRMQGLTTEFYRVLVDSPFRKTLEAKWGRQLFRLAETTLKTFHPSVLPLLQKENALVSTYQKLMASAEIEWQGEKLNLSQMGPYLQSVTRKVRKEAQQKLWAYFVQNADEYDRLYDELVHLRAQIAKELGFSNFTELAYARLNRTDYDASMVANFRRQVAEHLVPLSVRLKERQRERLHLDTLLYYDESLTFLSGNPAPKGDPQWILQNGVEMYRELSPETDEFFQTMVRDELLDLLSKKGKAVGGYCTNIPKYEAPYIFANFNGTYDDVTVLTHEAGHAFQSYMSRKYPVPEYYFPTLEACEIHSMSMEFLTWPWMDRFFEEDAEKFRFMHVSGALEFIPYGVAVDEFQHAVYANPDLTPAERKARWREVEKKYLPLRKYEDNEFLEEGGYWQIQTHIYMEPFYYIDYTLAQICAFQFWLKAEGNRTDAWRDYLHLCQLGGSKSFLELVQEANLQSPFEDGCVASVMEPLAQWLESVDDKNF
jgi:M3 family oligoendopeptidase